MGGNIKNDILMLVSKFVFATMYIESARDFLRPVAGIHKDEAFGSWLVDMTVMLSCKGTCCWLESQDYTCATAKAGILRHGSESWHNLHTPDYCRGNAREKRMQRKSYTMDTS